MNAFAKVKVDAFERIHRYVLTRRLKSKGEYNTKREWEDCESHPSKRPVRDDARRVTL